MPETNTNSAPVTEQAPVTKNRRTTIYIGPETFEDLAAVQRALRAVGSSASISEAVRYAAVLAKRTLTAPMLTHPF